MSQRQHCTPHLISGNSAAALTRVPFREKTFDEGWLQGLLFKHPSLFAIDEIEPVFAPAVSLALELPTEAGPIDLVCLNPDGYITLVETKLWRNPEARRKVVAQIIDYATAMSKWSYEQFRDAARLAGAPGDDPLLEAVAREDEDFEAPRFIDAVSRNLEKGRFLLLIVGDGIQEGVEHLAGTLSRSPHLGFTLGLVELAIFRGSSGGEPLFVQPRLVARTREIVRAVVEIKSAAATVVAPEIAVSIPEDRAGGEGAPKRKLTEEVFFEKLAAHSGQPTADGFREFLTKAEALGIEPKGREKSISLFWYEPNTGRRFSFGSVRWEDGGVDMNYVVSNYRKGSLDEKIGLDYVHTVAGLVPGAVVRDGFKDDKDWIRIFVSNRDLKLADVLPRADAWLRAIAEAMAKTEQAGATKAAV